MEPSHSIFLEVTDTGRNCCRGMSGDKTLASSKRSLIISALSRQRDRAGEQVKWRDEEAACQFISRGISLSIFAHSATELILKCG